jgi:hypothetical protein
VQAGYILRALLPGALRRRACPEPAPLCALAMVALAVIHLSGGAVGEGARGFFLRPLGFRALGVGGGQARGHPPRRRRRRRGCARGVFMAGRAQRRGRSGLRGSVSWGPRTEPGKPRKDSAWQLGQGGCTAGGKASSSLPTRGRAAPWLRPR